MEFIWTDGQDRDFAGLCDLLDASLEELAGHIIDQSKYSQYNTREKIRDVLLAYDGTQPVACGAIRHYAEAIAEVKRIFVREDYRGRGISKTLMALLENRAVEKGYTTLILETGAPLFRSISLYKKLGYQVIDNYGQYKDMKESVCLQKNLSEMKETVHGNQNRR